MRNDEEKEGKRGRGDSRKRAGGREEERETRVRKEDERARGRHESRRRARGIGEEG